MKQNYIIENLIYSGDKFSYKLDAASFDLTDYLHNVYIKIELPAIYSSNERQFKWNKYLGYNIIKDVYCHIKFNNSSKSYINLFSYSEWLYIWYELNLSSEEKKKHYELIGHTPELYDPYTYNNNIYPTSHLKKKTYEWKINDNNTKQATIYNITDDYNYNKPPSINSKTLYIPLNFYFCNNIKNKLPLGKIEFLEFKLTFRPIEELYSVLLIPEDFTLDTQVNIEHISDTNYNKNAKLSNDYIFLNNDTPIFSNSAHINSSIETELSIFDVLINQYRIKPINKETSMSTTSINNFILDKSNEIISNISNIILYNNFYISSQFCNASIIFNIIKSEVFTKKYITYSGLLSTFDSNNVPNNMYTDNNNTFNNIQFSLTINTSTNENINEVFLLLRHNKRTSKNDFFNFTNLDYNNINPWNNLLKTTTTYNSDIQIISNSLWEHLNTTQSIKIGVDELGIFYIKKHILDNGIFKYINIIEYENKSDKLNYTNKYNSNSNNIYNEHILDKLKISLNGKTKTSIDSQKYITSSAETYNFYNKISLYNKYNNTIPGLYYFTNSLYKLNNIIINECTGHKITIDTIDTYEYILYCNQKKEIIL
jgi:hypothetical protein